jgi:hypothetical protein
MAPALRRAGLFVVWGPCRSSGGAGAPLSFFTGLGVGGPRDRGRRRGQERPWGTGGHFFSLSDFEPDSLTTSVAMSRIMPRTVDPELGGLDPPEVTTSVAISRIKSSNISFNACRSWAPRSSALPSFSRSKWRDSASTASAFMLRPLRRANSARAARMPSGSRKMNLSDSRVTGPRCATTGFFFFNGVTVPQFV